LQGPPIMKKPGAFAPGFSNKTLSQKRYRLSDRVQNAR